MCSKPLPKWETLNSKIDDEMMKFFPFEKKFIKLAEQKWIMPYAFRNIGEKLYNFLPRKDDTIVMSFPRSGTTLTQELVWLLSNDLNFDEANNRHLRERYAFLDSSWHITEDDLDCCNKDDVYYSSSNIDSILDVGVKTLDKVKSPRYIKSHMPLDLVPNVLDSGCKIIYVARNPKDAMVSRYHFQKDHRLLYFAGNLDQYCDLFTQNLVVYSPYWEHIKSAWEQRCRPNFLFLFYEDLRNNMKESIKKISKFLGKTYEDTAVQKLMDHLTIENFRNNPMVNTPEIGSNTCQLIKPNNFIRKGAVGGWKNAFSAEIETKVDKWIEDNLKNTDIKFPSY